MVWHKQWVVLAILFVAACSRKDPFCCVQPEPAPTEAEVVSFDDFKPDPFDNETVVDFDVTKQASVGSITYIRGNRADFAKQQNPDPLKSQFAATLFSLALDDGLHNMVLARTILGAKDDSESLAVFVGDKHHSPLALHQQNRQHVGRIDALPRTKPFDFGFQLSADAAAQLPDQPFEVDSTTHDGSLADVRSQLTMLKKQAYSAGASDEAMRRYRNGQVALSRLMAQQITPKNYAFIDKQQVYSATSLFDDWAFYDAVDFSTLKYGYGDYGLVLYKSYGGFDGEDEQRNLATRIFGYRYGHDVDSKSSANDGAQANSWATALLYVAEGVNQQGQPPEPQLSWAVIPQRLEHVQYGRVTSRFDLDRADIDDAQQQAQWQKIAIVMAKLNPRQQHQNQVMHDNDLIDAYFYRGVGATSVEDMARLPQTRIHYVGHALTFGVDHGWHNNSDQRLPESFVNKGDKTLRQEAMGDFVSATFDVAEQSLSGSVYNVWRIVGEDKNKMPKAALLPNDIIRFQGHVVGNTVAGSAELTYGDDDKKGSFRASFYGKNAEEIGGMINSTTTADKYDRLKWGAVFGARQDDLGVAIHAPDINIDPFNEAKNKQ